MMELVAKICETQDRRFRYLEVVPELFGDLFFNLGKIKVTGLPSDVKVQAMVYDPISHVIVLRLWSLEFDVVDAKDGESEIPYCKGVRIERVTSMDDQKPASASASEANPWRYFVGIDDDCIRRVRRGDEGICYHKDGSVMPVPQSIEWYEEDAKRSMPFCREVTEAESAAILGDKPWEEKQ